MTDLELLARIIQCEAGGEGEQGMKAVACVVMNRVNVSYGEYGRLEPTIRAVIYQPADQPRLCPVVLQSLCPKLPPELSLPGGGVCGAHRQPLFLQSHRGLRRYITGGECVYESILSRWYAGHRPQPRQ